MARSTARAAAMQMIYEHLLGGQGGDETLEMVYEQLLENGTGTLSNDDKVYIHDVLAGALENLTQIDEQISLYSKAWFIDRIARVDLTILRLAVYELLFRKDVPSNVAVSEAVELANQYSEPANSRFINGVLGSVVRGLKDS